MRLANVEYQGHRFPARLEADGLLHRLTGMPPLGPWTDFSALRDARADNAGLHPDEIRFCPPVSEPRRVVCLGLNYRGHVEETGRELPQYPVLFCKWSDSLIGAHDDIVIPPESEQVDYEAELAVVIGAPMRRVSAEQALAGVAGLTAANDVTMRDYQYKTHQWLQGKAWPRSTPIGPYLVSGDELDYGSSLGISLSLNGRKLQGANTELMIFDVSTTIALLSEFVSFEPGDVILMGTPEGVGFRREPQVFLQHGDEVDVEIDGIGALHNRVTAEGV